MTRIFTLAWAFVLPDTRMLFLLIESSSARVVARRLFVFDRFNKVCDHTCGTGRFNNYNCNWRGHGATCRYCFNDVEQVSALSIFFFSGNVVISRYTHSFSGVEKHTGKACGCSSVSLSERKLMLGVRLGESQQHRRSETLHP